MRNKSFLWIFCLIIFFLSACGDKALIKYKVNKTPELEQYESELAEKTKLEESLAQESIEARERADEEEKAKEALVWKKSIIKKERCKVRGIYITDNTAGSERMEEILNSMKNTELNAVVIDIKNDQGRISYRMNNPKVKETGADLNIISDMPALLDRCHKQGLYVIARLVCFRDPYIGTKHPEWMNQKSDGSLFVDNNGLNWVNPYQKDYWEYIASVADSCADDGFDEIQLDYVRFCTEKGMQDVVYPEEAQSDKTKIITEFVRFMADRMAKKEVFFSADVFGTIIGSYVDTMSVGHAYPVMAESVDYMCPMIYPSHYGNGNFGISYPDTEPYKTIQGALRSSQKVLNLGAGSGGYQATVRPWLQGFTASYLEHFIPYGKEEIRAEINAVYDSGYEEWLVWNAANNYDFSAFLTKEQGEKERQDRESKRVEETKRVEESSRNEETKSGSD